MKKDSTIFLSFYPNARGLGYVCTENPQNLKESGMIATQPVSNEKALEHVVKFVDFFKPKIIILKDCNEAGSHHGKRAVQLMESISKYADEMKVPVYRYSRQQIRDVFEQFEAKSKYEIAQKIISWFPQLANRAPKVRKPWKAEEYNMGIFDALSLAITHQYLTE